jgi:hypothetical protein
MLAHLAHTLTLSGTLFFGTILSAMQIVGLLVCMGGGLWYSIDTVNAKAKGRCENGAGTSSRVVASGTPSEGAGPYCNIERHVAPKSNGDGTDSGGGLIVQTGETSRVVHAVADRADADAENTSGSGSITFPTAAASASASFGELEEDPLKSPLNASASPRYS